MPVLNPADATTCPPHHWFIQAQYNPQGSTESWICQRCDVARTVERQREQAMPRRLFTVGSSHRKPPAAGDAPTEPAGGGAAAESPGLVAIPAANGS